MQKECVHEFEPTTKRCRLNYNFRCSKCGQEHPFNKLSSEPLGHEFEKILNENFWDLLA